MSRNQHEAGKLRMHELPVTAFAALDPRESRPFEVGDKLANLARHTRDTATKRHSCQRQLHTRTAACSPSTHACQNRTRSRLEMKNHVQMDADAKSSAPKSSP